MEAHIMAQLRLVSLFAAIVSLLALLSGSASLRQNWIHVRSLHQLATCAGAPFVAHISYKIWLGMFDPLFKCPAMTAPGADPAYAAFAAWLNGDPVAAEKILDIRPEWRREIFAWRNSSQANLPTTYSAPDSPAVAQFVAHLSVEAWRLGQRSLAVTLADAVLARLTPDAADILASGISPLQEDQFRQFAYVREQIGQKLPDRVSNYIEWFEAAVHYQQWSSAAQACNRLRRYVQPTWQSQAAVCQARLAFYREDYATALSELRQVAQVRSDDALVWTWIGLSAKQLEEYADAEYAFQQAILYQEDPDSYLTLYWRLGDCQRALGKIAQARQSYRMALRYDQDERYQSVLEELLEQTQ
jgi:tetratricopeptide (TPR) repeat protein